MNKKKGGLLLSLRKDINRRAISDRRLEAIFRTFSRHPYIVAAFICLHSQALEAIAISF